MRRIKHKVNNYIIDGQVFNKTTKESRNKTEIQMNMNHVWKMEPLMNYVDTDREQY